MQSALVWLHLQLLISRGLQSQVFLPKTGLSDWWSPNSGFGLGFRIWNVSGSVWTVQNRKPCGKYSFSSRSHSGITTEIVWGFEPGRIHGIEARAEQGRACSPAHGADNTQVYIRSTTYIQARPKNDTSNLWPWFCRILTDFHFLTGRFLSKFAVIWLLKIQPHFAYVATLPRETLSETSD